jgi:Lrp/AsnC family leucine-responsive transcriptional regulator
MAGHELDQFDMRLLRALSENCRKTNKELVETVKLSHSAISRRITRLEEMGVLEGYSARINSSAIGLTVRAMVAVSREASVPAETLGATLAKLPGVIRSYVVTGEQDLFLEILAKDLTEFADLMLKGVQATKGVTTTKSIFVMRQWENNFPNAASVQSSGRKPRKMSSTTTTRRSARG